MVLNIDELVSNDLQSADSKMDDFLLDPSLHEEFAALGEGSEHRDSNDPFYSAFGGHGTLNFDASFPTREDDALSYHTAALENPSSFRGMGQYPVGEPSTQVDAENVVMSVDKPIAPHNFDFFQSGNMVENDWTISDHEADASQAKADDAVGDGGDDSDDYGGEESEEEVEEAMKALKAAKAKKAAKAAKAAAKAAKAVKAEEAGGDEEKKKSSRKSCAGRVLVRWNPGQDQLFLLALIYECSLRGIVLPLRAAARHVGDAPGPTSAEQHLMKVRKARIYFGLPVPPPELKTAGKGAKKKPEIAQWADDKEAQTFNTLTYIKDGYKCEMPGTIPPIYTPLGADSAAPTALTDALFLDPAAMPDYEADDVDMADDSDMADEYAALFPVETTFKAETIESMAAKEDVKKATKKASRKGPKKDSKKSRLSKEVIESGDTDEDDIKPTPRKPNLSTAISSASVLSPHKPKGITKIKKPSTALSKGFQLDAAGTPQSAADIKVTPVRSPAKQAAASSIRKKMTEMATISSPSTDGATVFTPESSGSRKPPKHGLSHNRTSSSQATISNGAQKPSHRKTSSQASAQQGSFGQGPSDPAERMNQMVQLAVQQQVQQQMQQYQQQFFQPQFQSQQPLQYGYGIMPGMPPNQYPSQFGVQAPMNYMAHEPMQMATTNASTVEPPPQLLESAMLHYDLPVHTGAFNAGANNDGTVNAGASNQLPFNFGNESMDYTTVNADGNTQSSHAPDTGMTNYTPIDADTNNQPLPFSEAEMAQFNEANAAPTHQSSQLAADSSIETGSTDKDDKPVSSNSIARGFPSLGIDINTLFD